MAAFLTLLPFSAFSETIDDVESFSPFSALRVETSFVPIVSVSFEHEPFRLLHLDSATVQAVGKAEVNVDGREDAAVFMTCNVEKTTLLSKSVHDCEGGERIGVKTLKPGNTAFSDIVMTESTGAIANIRSDVMIEVTYL